MCVTTKPVYSVDEDSFFFQPTLVPYQSECLRDGCSNKRWVTKMDYKTKSFNASYKFIFHRFQFGGFLQFQKKKMELDSVLEEIAGRGLINDEQPSLVCLHCLICHDLSSLVLSVLNLCHHCFEECPCLSSSTWKVCSYVIRRFDHQKTIPTEDDTSFSNYKDDNYIHHDQDLINVDYLKTRMSSLLEAFPEPFFNHAMAVKVKSFL